MIIRCAAIVAVTACLATTAVGAGPQAPVTADPVKGKVVFEQCIACHAFDDPKPAGPSLKGVFGRQAGTRDDFRYSPAMMRSGVVWSATTIDAFLADPQGYIRGNRMSFGGVAAKSDRDDLIAYLAQATTPTEGR